MGLLKLPKYMEMADGVQPVSGLREGDIYPYVVLTNFREHVSKGAKVLDEVEKTIEGGWEVNTVSGRYKNLPVTICCAGIGVGQTSNVMEELINLGGRVFIQIGATGAIQKDIELGDIIIPTGSVRDEGLTDYYAPKQYPALSDYRIVQALAEASEEKNRKVYTGIIRTTEGFYPSQRIEEYVETYNRLGVLSVEQEVSAILTVASVRGCYAGATLLVIGNLLTGLHSFNGDRVELLETDWFDQIYIILQAMLNLRKSGFPPNRMS